MIERVLHSVVSFARPSIGELRIGTRTDIDLRAVLENQLPICFGNSRAVVVILLADQQSILVKLGQLGIGGAAIPAQPQVQVARDAEILRVERPREQHAHGDHLVRA